MSPPLRVLHLIPGLEIGGLEIMVANLVEGLDRRAFAPALCCFDRLGPLRERLEHHAVPVHLLARRPGIDLRYPPRLARFLRDSGIDLLHLHNPTALFYGALAGRLAPGLRVVYTEHGRDYSRGLKARLANRLLSRLVDRIVVLSEPAREYLTGHEGMPARRMLRIYNGIDGSRFRPGTDPASVRAELGLAGARPLLGMVGRLDPIKHHALAFHALAALRGDYPDAALLVVGDGPLREELQTLARTLGLEESIRFLGARDDVPRLLGAMDALLLPSHSEGLSLTLIEGCAAGIPLVATDVGGSREIVRNGVNGLLIPAGDRRILTKALHALAADPAGARRMGEAGRRLFEAEFTLQGMVSHYQDLYRSLLQGRGP
jgi:sugar transferase (PEP-CTERM/EpsH1 system associated)